MRKNVTLPLTRHAVKQKTMCLGANNPPPLHANDNPHIMPPRVESHINQIKNRHCSLSICGTSWATACLAPKYYWLLFSLISLTCSLLLRMLLICTWLCWKSKSSRVEKWQQLRVQTPDSSPVQKLWSDRDGLQDEKGHLWAVWKGTIT